VVEGLLELGEVIATHPLAGRIVPELGDAHVRERFLGNAQILQVFSVSKAGKVAGCKVTDGVVQRGANVRLIRDNVVIHEGKLSQLKHLKDDVREVTSGHECGMSFENYQDMRVGDVIGARALLGRMTSATERDSRDLRVQLLEAHVRAAERALAR